MRVHNQTHRQLGKSCSCAWAQPDGDPSLMLVAKEPKAMVDHWHQPVVTTVGVRSSWGGNVRAMLYAEDVDKA
jgi:hypothetical protein